MKTILFVCALVLSGCSLTPAERQNLSQGVSDFLVLAVEQLAQIGKNPVAVTQATHDYMAFGCNAVEQGGPLIGTVIDILLARALEAPVDPLAQPVTGAEILSHINAGCDVLASLPIREDAAPLTSPLPVPSPV